MVRWIFAILLYSIPIIDIFAGTIKFLHDKNIEVQLRDAVHPKILDYSPTFKYPTSTIYHLAESDIHFYSLKFNSTEYYLWIEDSFITIEIDLSDTEISTDDFLLISKSNWLSGKMDSKNPKLKKLNEIDFYYANALDSLHNLALTDDQYRSEQSFNTIVWDSRSAKRLYNFAVETFSEEFDEKWVHYIPEYTKYWTLMYKLYYQYYHTNSFKGLNIKEIKSKIEADFNYPQSKFLVFHHFFKLGLSLNEINKNFEMLEGDLSQREKNMAEALVQKQAIKDLSNTQKIDFLFGIDIDGAMEGYFARDSSEKKHVLVFWSTWDNNMETEFNLLTDLKEDFKKEYNFVHICIDAYETPEKTKSFIYQNRVAGFHLLPEQSNAFRKSNFRKGLKIRDFPFYVLTDNQGEVIGTESIPLEISNRLENKLKYISTKK